MQKTAIAFVTLPLAFAAAGYAGGQALPAAAPKVPSDLAADSAPQPTAAALVLERLAEEEAAGLMTAEAGTALQEEAAAPASAAPDQAAAQAADPLQDPLQAKSKSQRNEANVVRLGRMRVPVYGAHSVTYVVSEIGVEMRDTEVATRFKEAENTSRLRDVALASLHRAAEGLSLTGASVETPRLAETLAADLRRGFGQDVSQVLVLSLLKAEVPRS